MNSTERYQKKWIEAIAKRTTKTEIKEHIIKHAVELLDRHHPEYGDHLLWVSSMYNLIKIYEAVYRIKSKPEFQVYRLLRQYEKNKKSRTPPPGNQIPRTVKLKATPKG